MSMGLSASYPKQILVVANPQALVFLRWLSSGGVVDQQESYSQAIKLMSLFSFPKVVAFRLNHNLNCI